MRQRQREETETETERERVKRSEGEGWRGGTDMRAPLLTAQPLTNRGTQIHSDPLASDQIRVPAWAGPHNAYMHTYES